MSDALTFGTLVHNVLEGVYTDYKVLAAGSGMKIDPERAPKFHLDRQDNLWKEEHPLASAEQMQQWENCMLMAEGLLPGYFTRWQEDFDGTSTWVGLEQQFDELFPLTVKDIPGVRVRGKIDGVRRIRGKLWLFETKTKTIIDDAAIMDTLSMDLQVNLYCWAVEKLFGEAPIGVTYNVLRRPQLRLKKGESIEDLALRVKEDVASDPNKYFSRFEVILHDKEFRQNVKYIERMLRGLRQWHDKRWFHFPNPTQCQGKYGLCEFARICSSADYTGLEQRAVCFPELDSTETAPAPVKEKDYPKPKARRVKKGKHGVSNQEGK